MTTVVEVGKKELCEKLRWSRPTLDKRLKTDPQFPVLRVGGKGGGWSFDWIAVQAYLNGAAATGDIDADDDQDEPTGQLFARAPVAHSGEATAAQRLKNAQAALQEDRLARQRGDLVDASDMRQVLSTVLAELKSALTNLPSEMGKEFGLSEREVQTIRHRIETSMRGISRHIRELLTDA